MRQTLPLQQAQIPESMNIASRYYLYFLLEAASVQSGALNRGQD
jgi:hypothetical protein